MPGTAFRMFFDDTAATVEQLRQVEEITVEQEMEMAWEARIRLSLCLDDRGRWKAPPNTTLRPFSRIRIELRLGEGDFRPLIDGPIAAFDTELAATPGTSTASIVVRDDSVLMNREDGIEVFEDKSDTAIADEVFRRFATISDTRIGAAGAAHPATVRRGTPIQFLRQLADANGYLAYVLPGETPGSSLGVFYRAGHRGDRASGAGSDGCWPKSAVGNLSGGVRRPRTHGGARAEHLGPKHRHIATQLFGRGADGRSACGQR